LVTFIPAASAKPGWSDASQMSKGLEGILAFVSRKRYWCMPYGATSMVDSSRFDVGGRLKGLIILKNFAVTRGYAVPDGIIDEIVNLEAILRDSQPEKILPTEIVKLDRLIRDISVITYPINSENVSKILEGNGVTRFSYQLLSYGLLAAILAGAIIGLINTDTLIGNWLKAPLAICLGVVGAVLYVMLPNGRLNIVAGLDEESIATNLLRVITGGLLGFVIYVVKPDFLNVQKGAEAYGLLAPLIGGYSITLVVGILAKAVTAVELTLNLDEKKTQASLRNR
jgi:hypothetical protein